MRDLITIIEQNLTELTGAKGSPEIAAMHDVLDPMHIQVSNLSRKNLLNAFLDHLEELGYRKLGAGTFGAVFTHPGIDYAVKVFKDDAAYMVFVRYCLANPGNPYLPKFRGKFMRIDDHYYVVRMQTLSGKLNRADSQAAMWLNTLTTSDQDQAGFLQFLEKALAGKSPTVVGAAKVLIANPGLIETVLDLRSKKGQFKMDLHAGNFMKNDEGQLVIADPFYIGDER